MANFKFVLVIALVFASCILAIRAADTTTNENQEKQGVREKKFTHYSYYAGVPYAYSYHPAVYHAPAVTYHAPVAPAVYRHAAVYHPAPIIY